MCCTWQSSTTGTYNCTAKLWCTGAYCSPGRSTWGRSRPYEATCDCTDVLGCPRSPWSRPSHSSWVTSRCRRGLSPWACGSPESASPWGESAGVVGSPWLLPRARRCCTCPWVRSQSRGTWVASSNRSWWCRSRRRRDTCTQASFFLLVPAEKEKQWSGSYMTLDLLIMRTVKPWKYKAFLDLLRV